MEGRHSVSSNTAAEIVDKLGGSANIESLTHCATRLRFTLHDASGVQQSDLEAVPGVMGAVPQAGDRYQVVIGGGVQTVYNEIKALPGLGGSAGGDDAGGHDVPGRLLLRHWIRQRDALPVGLLQRSQRRRVGVHGV